MSRLHLAHARSGSQSDSKLVGVDPNAYLRRALHAAIARPGAITLPDDLLSAPPPA
jgi:hypothetical protein